MKRTKKTAVLTVLSICMMLSVIGMGPASADSINPVRDACPVPVSNTEEAPELIDCPLVYSTESAGANLRISIDDFNALGFACGDSVDLSFSNGYTLEDLPYYSGYFVEAYQPLLVAYPGAEYVKACINYGEDLWKVAGLSEGDTASVRLHEKAKYLAIQEAMDIRYTNDREDYESDEEYANFRCVTAGSIKENNLYRSASPCNNKYRRASTTDDLAEAAGVNFMLNLSDNEEQIGGFIAAEDFDSPWFLELYQNGKVVPLYLSMNFLADDFQKTLAEGLNVMADQEGPYLVHCVEGKDRTGFVCILLEALCGASYDEIEDDYMLTYDNYYGINEQTDPERYRILKEQNMDVMLEAIVGDESVDITSADLSKYAEEYLIRIGVSEQAVEKLKANL